MLQNTNLNFIWDLPGDPGNCEPHHKSSRRSGWPKMANSSCLKPQCQCAYLGGYPLPQPTLPRCSVQGCASHLSILAQHFCGSSQQLDCYLSGITFCTNVNTTQHCLNQGAVPDPNMGRTVKVFARDSASSRIPLTLCSGSKTQYIFTDNSISLFRTQFRSL